MVYQLSRSECLDFGPEWPREVFSTCSGLTIGPFDLSFCLCPVPPNWQCENFGRSGAGNVGSLLALVGIAALAATSIPALLVPEEGDGNRMLTLCCNRTVVD